MKRLLSLFITITVILTTIILNQAARAENLACQDCEELVNLIFESDQRGTLHPELTAYQIMQLNNICDSDNLTEDDVEEIAPQYFDNTQGIPGFIYKQLDERED